MPSLWSRSAHFAGALLLEGYTKGVFVTTSRFQAGADRTARLALLRGIQIDLLDAKKFYGDLSIAQRNVYRRKEEVLELLEGRAFTLLARGGKW